MKHHVWKVELLLIEDVEYNWELGSFSKMLDETIDWEYLDLSNELNERQKTNF